MCAAASGGQILISDVVRVLAGSRSICPLSSAGALELKGLDAPVLAWQVDWEQWQLPCARLWCRRGLSRSQDGERAWAATCHSVNCSPRGRAR